MLTRQASRRDHSRFRIFQRTIYLNSCSQGALSDAVEDGLDDYIASCHEQGSPWGYWWSTMNRAVRFAQFISTSGRGCRRYQCLRGVKISTGGCAKTHADETKQVEGIRSRFRIFQRTIYLNSCSQGALSDAVEDGLDDYIASWHEQGSPWELWVNHYEVARSAFAQFINASPDEVAIVTSASAGINSVASSLNFKERPKVILGEFEFPTMGHVWLAQRVRGADVRFVKAQGNRILPADYESLIDRSACIVPLTHVCFRNGFRSDVAAITNIAHRSGAIVMLDDYQDCGTRPIDVKALNLDFYVTGTLKYLLGPPGLAFLYVRKELISSLIPTVTGWFAQENPFRLRYTNTLIYLRPRGRFESGSPSGYPMFACGRTRIPNVARNRHGKCGEPH